MAMNKAALSIWRRANDPSRLSGGAEGSIPGYRRAAEGVSDINLDSTDIDQMPKTCNSITGQFLFFYYGGEVNGSQVPGDSAGCPVPLSTLITDYFNRSTSDAGYDPTFYTMSFSWNTGTNFDQGKNLMTAYMPGPFTGVGPDGNYVSPIQGSSISDTMRRNTYSTKFVALDSLLSGRDASYDNRGFSIQSEGEVNESGEKDTSLRLFRNALNPAGGNADISAIKY
jgi:hypothetical protein